MQKLSIQHTAAALAAAALLAACGGGGSTPDKAVTGETGTCTAAPCYNFSEATLALVDFGGLGIEVTADPKLATNKVVKLTKEATDEKWAGVTVHFGGAGNSVPRIDPSKTISLRVYSPAAGKTVMVKVENAANGNINAEASATSTKAGEWETLTFTFASADAAATYNKISVFPGFGTQVAEVYYIDELKYSTKADDVVVPPAAGLTLVNFDEATPAVLDAFEGTTFAAATDGTNKVAQLNKPMTAQAWGGATFKSCPADTVGMTPSIPFSASNQTITVRVKSPRAGVVFSLEARGEGANAATEVFAEATNTGTDWETLSFNFANKTYGAAIDPSKAYNKLSIFPNFSKGNEGAAAKETADRVYLIDDVKLAGSDATLAACPAVPVSTSPNAAAANPTATNLVTLFSDASGYAAVPNGTFRTDWSDAAFAAEAVAGNNVLKYSGLNFVGIEPASPIDISTATYVNLDIWTPDLSTFRVKLVNFLNGNYDAGTNKEHEVSVDVSGQRSQWHRIRIPMADFTGLTQRTHVKQVILSVGDGVKGTVYVDNFFFSTN